VTCDTILEREGVWGIVNVYEYPLSLCAWDDDLLSMADSNFYTELFLDSDPSRLYYIGEELHKFQKMFGKFPSIVGRGENSQRLAELLIQLESENKSEKGKEVNSKFSKLILLDRSVDHLTPLCTALTYEGLVDEIFGIKNMKIEVPDAWCNKNCEPDASPSPKFQKVVLNSVDPLYQEIRILNFSVIGSLLHDKAKSIQERTEKRNGMQTIKEIKHFVHKLSGLQQEQKSLTIHTHLAERILTFTQDSSFRERLETEQNMLYGTFDNEKGNNLDKFIARGDSISKVLRLLCIYSIVSSGLKKKQFDYYRTQFLQTYGYQHIITLANLQKLHILRLHDASFPYSLLVKSFALINEDIDEHQPDDIAFVHSGFQLFLFYLTSMYFYKICC